MKRHLCWLMFTVMAAARASAQDLPRGQIINDVECRNDPSQHYALYVPSNFTPARAWPVILLFDAMARGPSGVERYQAAAEKYGYIVAGSNNSRNGPWEIALDAARAMSADVDRRFPVDPKRRYTGGMSGGARVAMLLALTPGAMTASRVAGVFASSAGFPEGLIESVPFPIFGTVGTDDFNHHEMLELDTVVKTAHRVERFEGGHTWLPVEVATDGVEWMEIQAMRTGLRPRDQRLIDELFAKRVARAEAQKSSLDRMRELKSIVVDFDGFKDVRPFKARADTMAQQQDVQDALKEVRAEDERELRMTAEVNQLRDRMKRGDNFARLKERVLKLLDQSKAADDSSDRRVARRVLGGFRLSLAGVHDPEVLELLNQIRPSGQAAPK